MFIMLILKRVEKNIYKIFGIKYRKLKFFDRKLHLRLNEK